MKLVRHVVPTLLVGLLSAVRLHAQDTTAVVTGRVVDATTQQPLPNVEVSVVGTPHRELSKSDGNYLISRVPAGPHRLRATRIGYGSQVQDVTLSAGQSIAVNFTLEPAAAILEPVVVTGYGTQRREAITGSVSTVSAAAANVGVVNNVDQMIQGRAAGVDITRNNGEPGAGVQILVRGGSSISNSNEPLYVIDGVAIDNRPTEPPSYGIGGTPPLPRNPLNLLNPADIASITILKDASATAIYGSRAANGVVLIETKKGGTAGGPTVEYDTYAATASPANRLDVLTAGDYTQFVNGQVTVWRGDSTAFHARHPGDTVFTLHFGDSSVAFNGLKPSHQQALGSAVTDWQNAITRTSVTHNHDLSFSGGSEDTRYRASLNYMKNQGVVLSSGLERIQGRLAATHRALDNRLRLGVNVTTSRVNNQYTTFENRAGFEGGAFLNAVIFNPTQPVTVTDATGTRYYETGAASVPYNPVAIVQQITDIGNTTRTLGNATAELDLLPGLTGQVTVGLDHSAGARDTYYPNSIPWGARLGGGLARQYALDQSTQTLQTLLTLRRQIGEIHSLDVVGGYEYTKFASDLIMAQGQGFFTDVLTFNNLGVATTRNDSSWSEGYRLVSFLSRANYGYKDRFFLTGVLRYDGTTKFAEGHKWALFPGLSGSWHLSQEEFMHSTPFSDLRVRLGWGRQGNPGIPPYESLRILEGGIGATYPWGSSPQAGVIPTRNGNPNLKWEQTTQYNGAVDFGLLNNRLVGSVEYYVKNTSDLLLEVNVAQPAVASTRFENVGKLRNRGFEVTLDALVASHPGLTWRAGLVFAAERNKVLDLGPYKFIQSGVVSGQGQSNVWAERIMVCDPHNSTNCPGYPLGTFYGPVFVGVSNGQQMFRCVTPSVACVNGTTTSAGLTDNDYAVIGNANPDFTVGLHNRVNWRNFDISFLLRASVGQDVFNNTALVYSTKSDALQDKNFLRPALTDGTGLHEPAVYSSRWIERASFLRLQNVTVEYNLDVPILTRSARSARLYVSADNLFVITGYSGLDPEVSSANTANSGDVGLAARGIDYLTYPRARTVTGGLRIAF
ncbi:MAG TPA: SusC/RagA family TonB-linked outer membrane protein [Gemmatimonadales bacterium]|nr:SusC/RagA family TonB-linked outer membrane protein [Gemmatimonadales bacterium]